MRVINYLQRLMGDLQKQGGRNQAANSRSLEFHPLSLLFIASGSMMISKTLRIPKP